ncbi:SIMPL domain-containing protein [Anaeroselena agilis]|uniref:SIMPL domain-containing protein n=1 Tax=Anaeroselena agilis TaxID=3063788 RepID=A0ABU3P4V9_9FIRM|nr:SIMPL domain-containing protein [Selenomonadales bacterium 4137-cl]
MLKRSLVVFTVLSLLAACLAGPALAAPADGARTITVTGHAEAAVTPDIAFVTAGIVTTGADAESARADNDRTMRRIIDALAAQGTDKGNIATSQFSLQPIYRNDGKDGAPGTISGYRLQNSVTVKVEDLAKIGPVIDAAFAAGANQFQGLRFAVRDDDRLHDELLRKAVLDGRHKASVMADALGVALGQPLSVSEGGRYMPVQFDAVRSYKAAGTPIEAGTMTVSVDVNLVFGM